jgi:hypothetical protein
MIPRADIRSWTSEIAENAKGNQAALKLMLKLQRVLAKYVHTNVATLTVRTGAGVRSIAATIRIFDLVGGRLDPVTAADIATAEEKVGAAVGQLLPADRGVPERLRAVSNRAQAHLLDELVEDLFDGEDELGDAGELLQLFCILWVAVECLDAKWSPGVSFKGETDYVFVPKAD